jgi:hypothetical protein
MMTGQETSQDNAGGQSAVVVSSKPIARDPLLYSVSPLQLWVGRLVSRVNKAKTMEDGWLPVFSSASTHLRTVFAALQRDRRPILAFLLQMETGGMLLGGAFLEVISLRQNCNCKLHLSLQPFDLTIPGSRMLTNN